MKTIDQTKKLNSEKVNSTKQALKELEELLDTYDDLEMNEEKDIRKLV